MSIMQPTRRNHAAAADDGLCIREADLVEHGPTNEEGGPGTEAKQTNTTMGVEAGRELNQ